MNKTLIHSLIGKVITRIILICDTLKYRYFSIISKGVIPTKTYPRVFLGIIRKRRNAASLKTVKLKTLFGNADVQDNNILYVCTGNIPLWFCEAEKKRGVKIIVNQNGVYYPGWYGNGYLKANEKYLLGHYRLADYIIYQSSFCKESAEVFLGKAHCENSILSNPVDTEVFVPEKERVFRENNPRFLATGIFYNKVKLNRLKMLIESLKILIKDFPCAQLTIAGFMTGSLRRKIDFMIKSYFLQKNITILYAYDYAKAPSIYRLGDIYLNTQFNAPCPSAVLEAMSCGLPVVYLDCGGTPELVGDAGVGVKVEKSWTEFRYPNPEEVAVAIKKVIMDYNNYGKRSRERSIKLFDQEIWKREHEKIFEKVLR